MKHHHIVDVLLRDREVQSIACTKIGQFCVHRSFEKTKYWRVTHFLSGAAVPGYWKTGESGLAAATVLDKLGAWDIAVSQYASGDETEFAKLRLKTIPLLKKDKGYIAPSKNRATKEFVSPKADLVNMIAQNKARVA